LAKTQDLKKMVLDWS